MHQTFSQRSAGMTSEAETRPLLSCEAPGEMLNCSETMKLMLYHVTVATFKISPNFISSTHIHTIQTITFEQSQSKLNAVSIETVCHFR